MYGVFSNRSNVTTVAVTCGTVESITMSATWACKLLSRLVSDCHLEKTVDGKVFSVTKTQCVKKDKTNKMQQSDVYYQLLSQHVSGVIMPIFRRTKTVLLHKVYCAGSAGCGW